MVNKKITTHIALIILIFLAVPVFGFAIVRAADIEYYIRHQWVKIWINQDGTIDLLYDVEVVCTGGTISYMRIGQPNTDFTTSWALDENDLSLTTEDIRESSYYAVRITLRSPISEGESARFKLLTNVGYMIWEDEQNPGNVGMQFNTTWYSDAIVSELKVNIVFPEGVESSDVRCTPDWDNAFHDQEEDNKLVLYWEKQNLGLNEKLDLWVSFPKEYIDHYEVREKGLDWATIGLVVAGVAVAGLILFAAFGKLKKGYSLPVMRMETMGVRRGLTAVEASHLLGLPPAKIVAAILFSLLMKKVIWVKVTDPVLQVEAVKQTGKEGGKAEDSLRYYELRFLNSVKEDGTIDEVRLARTLMLLRDTVEAKLHGYNRHDTMEYYRKIVAKAWEQVKQAGTPDLASKAYSENLLWLLLDKNVQSETDEAFGSRYFVPQPDWWWYWYIFTRHRPRVETPLPTGDRAPPAIPGADLADKVVTSLEQTSNNVVANLEKFAGSILPSSSPPKPRSSRSARRGVSCVCACAACACACACVSCACACASGGAG